MKKMTCSQMGGGCDAELMGSTSDEMIINCMKHLEEVHPDLAASVKAASPTDPMMVAWHEKFKKDFEAAQEV